MMNIKRWLWASVAVFAVIAISDFIVHGMLLSDLYRQTASVWRPPQDARQLMWIFWIGYLVFAPLFTLIYAKGYESQKAGLGQGLRFGLYVGGMLSVLHSYGWYVVLPIPLVIACYWFAAIWCSSASPGSRLVWSTGTNIRAAATGTRNTRRRSVIAAGETA
jgi:hypothetical protein